MVGGIGVVAALRFVDVVGGTGVTVAGIAVAVAGTGVAVAGTGVAVAGRGVAAALWFVAVAGRIGVALGATVARTVGLCPRRRRIRAALTSAWAV
jgi:hypothetical protein